LYYAIATGLLVKKFQLSHNKYVFLRFLVGFVSYFFLISVVAFLFRGSLEVIADRLRSDRLVDGVSLDNLNVEQTDSNNPTSQNKLAFPGTAKLIKGNLSTNSTLMNSDIMTYSLLFSLMGKEFAVVSSEGVQIYSLDSTMQFIPIDLDLDISPENTRKLYHLGNYVASLHMVIILNINYY
jgi:hypothetical protein